MSGATSDAEVVVIGGGAMGSSTAWQLAARGWDVHLLERFEPGHVFGASHGRSRNFNTAYSDPTYAAMLAEASRLWPELEQQTGERILNRVGIVNHGPNADFDRVAAALRHVGLGAEFLSPEEAGERWAGIRFDGRVLFAPDSGRLDADTAVTALKAAAAARGAVIEHGVRVVDISPDGDERVTVTTESGVIRARRAVVTAGAWTEKLLGDKVRLPRLRVTQEQPAHFALCDDSAAASALAESGWPGFNHSYDPTDPRYGYWRSPIYGMYTPGFGVKAGWHGAGPEVDPDRRDFLPEPKQLDDLRRYVDEWLPGADPDRFDPISCTYTSTVDENFILDRVGPIVVGAGFSGHGFKFTPTVGRILADLATGEGAAPQLFRINR
ncbi:FAD-dependent oxidoreductase [Leifsonia poae]|uniref:FAD-dependent oxidoreductase n=1 Tax=Leifsonia poae TaxID=110933 RepID=UPI003D679BC6